MADPAWAPTTAKVASYIPGWTVAVATTSDALLNDFTAATRPTGTAVSLLISDACVWVSLRTGDMVTTGPKATALAVMATATAALRTAGMVALSYPQRRPDSMAVAQQLLAQADAALKELADANMAAGAADTGPAVLLPTGNFPLPPTWGDDLLI